MKIVNWKRPHLTAFGHVVVLPGSHEVKDEDAKAIAAHWSFKRAEDANLIEITEAGSAAVVASAKKTTTGKKPADA